MRSSSRNSVKMSLRNWVECDVIPSSHGSGFDTDPDSAGESGISSCSSVASIDDFMGSYREERRFRIATYNILTDKCIHPETYLYCPEEMRFMNGRHARIVAEIRSMSPDVVCLQEVDYDHYETRMKKDMQEMGYRGVLHERLDDQGMAVFWKDSAFQLVQQKHCLLHHLAETHIQMSEIKPELKKTVRRAIERPEALLLVRLRHCNSGSHLAIANVHVIWAQLRYPALQSLQVSVAAAELAEFAKGFHCSQIICGDFNSHPDSIVYNMLSTGRLDPELVDNLRNSDSNLIEEADLIRAVNLFDLLPTAFTIKSKLKSAYKTALGSEPPITNCDDAGQSFLTQLCLDYIFYSPSSLEVAGVLDTPSSESITKHYALPSVDFPSDHLPLMAEIIFK